MSIDPLNSLPNNAGKNLRVWGIRGSRIGDQVFAIPVYSFLRRRKFPDCYTHFQIARRHAIASAPLWIDHPEIDKIVVSDCDEGMGPRDHAIAQTCHIRFDVMPRHPDGDLAWPNDYSVWEETWRMTGLPLHYYHELPKEFQTARLYQWFPVERQSRGTIALWPASNYGTKQEWCSRFPSRYWMIQLARRLTMEGFRVIQCGHPNDYSSDGGSLASDITGVMDVRNLDFFSQIRLSLGCDAVIGTDSGSTIVLAAYQSVPVIQLLTNHTPGHNRNLLAFASNSPTCLPIFAVGSADNIPIDDVVSKLKQSIT